VSLPKDTARDPRADALLTAALHAADGVEASGCPDAEEMGLYVERELAGAERRAVEAHVHTCPRCQAIVAAFVRALPDEGETADVVAGAGEAGGLAHRGGARGGVGGPRSGRSGGGVGAGGCGDD
jgi:hypothetical protein